MDFRLLVSMVPLRVRVFLIVMPSTVGFIALAGTQALIVVLMIVRVVFLQSIHSLMIKVGVMRVLIRVG